MFYFPLWYLSSFLLFRCCNFQGKRREAKRTEEEGGGAQSEAKKTEKSKFSTIPTTQKQISGLFGCNFVPGTIETLKN